MQLFTGDARPDPERLLAAFRMSGVVTYIRREGRVGMAERGPLSASEFFVSGGGGLVLWLELAVIGAVPIVALALSLLELVPLHISGPSLVGSAVVSVLALLVLEPRIARHALRGWGAGLVAVLVYDCTRVPFVIFGGWPDFIPKIGAWLLDAPRAHWLLGYGWRYLGNGAGMGLTFSMLVLCTDRWIDRRVAGVAYGVAIWAGLVATLMASPDGESKMFDLNPTTIAASLTGHLVYGAVLGLIMYRERNRGVEPSALPAG